MYRLRELRREDMPKINEWRNDSELIDFLGAPFRYINLDVDYRWYDNYMQNRNVTIRCAIVKAENEDDILGLVSLVNINFINQSAEFHIMIGDPTNRGKGIGFFATSEILYHAFNNMNLNRIELGVLGSNFHAIKLYEKIGFKREGVKRKSTYKNGKFVDMIMMAILKEEFTKLHKIPGRGGKSLLSPYCILKLQTLDEIYETLLYMSDSYAMPLNERFFNLYEYANKLYYNAEFFVAVNINILGYIVFYANDRESMSSYITQIAVKREFQNKNIGKKLLNICVESSLALGMKNIKLEVRNDNTKAIGFYVKNGFKFCDEATPDSMYMIKNL